MEAFPVNHVKSDRILLLGDHYHRVLQKLGYEISELPESLFFTFCGDLLGSSGEHYQKGKELNFFEAIERASLLFSDDFMESLAMYLMRAEKINPDLEGLLAAKDIFFDEIASHFETLSETYSPWFGSIRNAATPDEFYNVTSQHASCGAAMRAAVTGALGLSDEQAFKLFAITHLHPEAIEGGFWVKGYAEAAGKSASFEDCLKEASIRSSVGLSLLKDFLGQQTLPPVPEDYTPLNTIIDHVLDACDPYASITDIQEEGIETRYVVGAAAHILASVHDNAQTGVTIPKIVTDSLRIGGDPDTICSITTSLYGLQWPKESKAFMDQTRIGTYDKNTPE